MPAHERFYEDKMSEAGAEFSRKSQVYSSVVMPHTKTETHHTNKNKNVGYIKTSSGSIITFVPFSQNASVLPAQLSPRDKPKVLSPQLQIPYDVNHLKIKLHNPINQLRRNQSHISQFFS